MKTKRTALYAAFAVVFGLAIVATSPVSADNHDDMDYNDSYIKMNEEMHTEVKTAVEANDYNLLSEESMEEIDEERFAEMVEKHAMMEEHQAAVEEAIAAKDYDAFVLAIESNKETREEYKDDDDMDDDDKAEKMMERYEELVAYYDENGMLPEENANMRYMGNKNMGKGEISDEMKAEQEARKAEYDALTDEEKKAIRSEKGTEMKEKMGDMKEQGMKNERKYFKESHRGIVKNVIKSVDHDRLEKALTRIESTLAVVTDETVIDLLEGIKEVIMETLEG